MLPRQQSWFLPACATFNSLPFTFQYPCHLAMLSLPLMRFASGSSLRFFTLTHNLLFPSTSMLHYLLSSSCSHTPLAHVNELPSHFLSAATASAFSHYVSIIITRTPSCVFAQPSLRSVAPFPPQPPTRALFIFVFSCSPPFFIVIVSCSPLHLHVPSFSSVSLQYSVQADDHNLWPWLHRRGAFLIHRCRVEQHYSRHEDAGSPNTQIRPHHARTSTSHPTDSRM